MKAGNLQRWITWLVVLGLAGVGGLFGWRWYQKRSNEAPPDYRTGTVSRGDLTQSVTANGQISPVKSVTVGSQVSGIITDIKVDFNSRVTNGQIIAQIDPSTYQQNVNQAEAELANAQAALELTQLNHRRAKSLLESQLVSQSDYDKTLVDLHQAEAVLKVREAAVNKAKVDLQRTTIYSPIDGIVISRAVDVGQTVAASFNTPTLFNIANDLRNMRIEAMVSEADVGGVREGQHVTFTVEAYPARQFSGEVTQVRFAAITNQNVVNYVSVITVTNEDLKLRPGMTANASIIVAQKTDALRLPNAALRFRPPEKAAVTGATNAPAKASGATNKLMAAASPDDGASGPPRGGFSGLSPEERQRRMESMTPEQREAWRARRRSGEGRPGPSGSNSAEGPVTRTIYLVEKSETPSGPVTLKAVTVKTGITDGIQTEVLDGLKEGDVVAVGLNQATTSATAVRPGGSSPFGGPFGGMRPPR